jgi:hypothetical protein
VYNPQLVPPPSSHNELTPRYHWSEGAQYTPRYQVYAPQTRRADRVRIQDHLREKQGVHSTAVKRVKRNGDDPAMLNPRQNERASGLASRKSKDGWGLLTPSTAERYVMSLEERIPRQSGSEPCQAEVCFFRAGPPTDASDTRSPGHLYLRLSFFLRGRCAG